MSFLDDILQNDESLNTNTASTDPVILELLRGAAKDGNLQALKTAVDRGQLDKNTPLDLVLDIVSIAGDRLSNKINRSKGLLKDIENKVQFIEEWVNVTTPDSPVERQNRLDLLLQACFHHDYYIHDDIASKLVSMGANPLTQTLKVATSLDAINQHLQGLYAGAEPSPFNAVAGAVKHIVEPEQPSLPGRDLSVIGTAGRDKDKPMTAELWEKMLADCRTQVRPDDHLISGGAAWADHLAVVMFLEGRVSRLTLRLPSPIENGVFTGPRNSAGSAASYYHELFQKATGIDSMAQILQAIEKGAVFTEEPAAPGYSAMFARNKKVAQESNAVLAYTFGEGDEPADGGTSNTWGQIKSNDKVHVPLDALLAAPAKDYPAVPAEKPATPVTEVVEAAAGPQDGKDVYLLSGARYGLGIVSHTVLADAIYGGADSTKNMCQKLAKDPYPLPTVAQMRRFDMEAPVNAAAYAVVCADMRQLDMVISSLPKNEVAKAQLDDALGSIMALKLHEFGSDEVQLGMARILAAGASGPHAQRLVNEKVIVCEAAATKFTSVNGKMFEGEDVFEGEGFAKAIQVSFAASLLSGKDMRAVAGALRTLSGLGLDVNACAIEKVPGQDQNKVAEAFAGASIVHLAALRGDGPIFTEVQSSGGKAMGKDAEGRTAVDYAFAGLHRASAFSIFSERATQLQTLEGTNPSMPGSVNIADAFALALAMQLPGVENHVPQVHQVKRQKAGISGASAQEKAAQAQGEGPADGFSGSEDIDAINAQLMQASDQDYLERVEPIEDSLGGFTDLDDPLPHEVKEVAQVSAPAPAPTAEPAAPAEPTKVSGKPAFAPRPGKAPVAAQADQASVDSAASVPANPPSNTIANQMFSTLRKRNEAKAATGGDAVKAFKPEGNESLAEPAQERAQAAKASIPVDKKTFSPRP